MLIIMMALIGAVALIVVGLRRDKISLLILALCGSFITMLAGIVIYTAKIGGFSRNQQILLFLLPNIQQYLQYLPITLDVQGYAAAVGRCCFPCVLLLIALNYSMSTLVRRHIRKLRILAYFVVIWLVYYYPAVFRMGVRGRWKLQRFMGVMAMVWIMACLLLALCLLLHEYRSISIPYFKKNFRYILLSYISMAFLYIIYGLQDPAQIYQYYSLEFLWIWRGSYTAGIMYSISWAALILCSVFFVILGSVNLLRYTQITYHQDKESSPRIRSAENRETVSLQSRFDQTSLGASVFVHSMKNQLLANRILNKKLGQALKEESPDLEKIRGVAAQLNQLNESMVTRMEDLYRAIRTNSILLTPVSVREIAEAAMGRFHQKYPDRAAAVALCDEGLILADKEHLAEAVYNLLCNGQDAIAEAGRESVADLRLTIRRQRLYTVLEVHDNGKGISRTDRLKIYEPFYTSKNTSYNWGMGLYYVRNIVKSHYGTLRIESHPETGTSFFIMLPSYGTEDTEKRGGSRGKENKNSGRRGF